MAKPHPITVTEQWLAAKLGDGAGFRVDAILAHGKRDGHLERDIRAAHRRLAFVEFPEPGTNAPAWSSFMLAVKRADGTILFADGSPAAPVVAARPDRSMPTVSAATPGQAVPAAPKAPAPPAPYGESELADRRVQIAMSDEAEGRKELAAALVTMPGVTPAQARGILRRAARTTHPAQVDTAPVGSQVPVKASVDPYARMHEARESAIRGASPTTVASVDDYDSIYARLNGAHGAGDRRHLGAPLNPTSRG